MFDLESNIDRWRDSLAQRDAFLPEHVDELEDHLRSHVTRLSDGEVTPEEAFLLATRRLGSPEELDREFGKTNSSGVWANRILWMLIGLIVLGAFKSLAGLAAPAAQLLISCTFGPGTMANLSFWLMQLLAWGFMLVFIGRQVTSQRSSLVGWLDRAVGWAANRPAATILLVFIAYLGLPLIHGLLFAMTLRMSDPTEFGKWQAIGVIISRVGNLLLITGVAWWMYRRQRGVAVVAE